jgi:hypothetical protein
MDHNHPSPSEVLSEYAGWAFVLGVVTMSLFPLALPVLLFGLLALPLLLPLAVPLLLYGMYRLVRRYVAGRRARISPSKTSTARPPTRTSFGVPGSP